jgi:hypothetical protein
MTAAREQERLYDQVPRFIRRLEGYRPIFAPVFEAIIELAGPAYECTAMRSEILALAGVGLSTLVQAIAWAIARGVLESLPDDRARSRRKLRLLWRMTARGVKRLDPSGPKTHQRSGARQATAKRAPGNSDAPAPQPRCARHPAAHTIKRERDTGETTVPSPVPRLSPRATPAEPPPETGRDGSSPSQGTRTAAAGGYTPPSAAELARLEAEAQLTGHRRTAARIALAAWRSYRAGDTGERPAEAPPPRPATASPPATTPPARAAPSPRRKVPRGPSYPLEAVLEVARAIRGGDADPEAQERLVRLLAGRWRDRKPETLDCWRAAVARLPAPDLVDLISGCDHPELRLPGNAFSARAGERMRADPK